MSAQSDQSQKLLDKACKSIEVYDTYTTTCRVLRGMGRLEALSCNHDLVIKEESRARKNLPRCTTLDQAVRAANESVNSTDWNLFR